ncbi:SMI1/KNR4 family protein [Enterobacter hormaechei]|uniref:SMI1/KNR4 family protein n=1 Tax=Enterobacter hormaechei TaxID=158836 RepID=UPI000F8711FA|nr:SMI1/KNR4 family protein [Enterobacter hormaechei]HAV1392774.1 SMI1/KNR4 family protein [Enterobacter hormaechei subsp. steigerwaltii]MBF9761956.1 SMI1/KNR4 family protein [Enterobacter hormaechei]MBF9766152.1 SMI1/KNR4 family protein [Enterobacter hormaechei]MCM7726694.1 SMI1/KNR4 family protein [Enterobacter hormaechei]MRN73046.1 SMI1/KNR4 family protein [Enterobacter hormaechei]
MEKQDLIDQLNKIEKLVHASLPSEYKRFLIEKVKDIDSYEIKRANGDQLYVFNCFDVLDRNNTYTIQEAEPNFLLIGQDGDLGYFLNLREGTDEIYSLDLGALGSLDMDKESDSIFML